MAEVVIGGDEGGLITHKTPISECQKKPQNFILAHCSHVLATGVRTSITADP